MSHPTSHSRRPAVRSRARSSHPAPDPSGRCDPLAAQIREGTYVVDLDVLTQKLLGAATLAALPHRGYC